MTTLTNSVDNTLEELDETMAGLGDDLIEQTQRNTPKKPNFAEMREHDRKLNRGYYKEMPDLSVCYYC